MLRHCTAAGLLALLAVPGSVAEDTPQTFPKALHGAWLATYAEYSGRKPPDDIVRKYMVTIKADSIVLDPLNIVQGKFFVEGEPIEVRYRLHPQAKPKAIDLFLKEDNAEHRMLGIYAVDGDHLKICWQHDGKARPTEFKTKAEPPQMLLILKRASSPPQPPTFQVPTGWKTVEAGSFTSARFQIGGGDRVGWLTVTGLKGDGGGLAANINRWRVQLGLEPLAAKDALIAAQPIQVAGLSGHLLDLAGPEVTGKAARRILTAVVRQGNLTWFFKLEGPASLVAAQKGVFDGFLKSVRFKK